MTNANMWAVKSNRIIDGTNGEVLTDGVVIVDGDKIALVGPQSTTVLPRGVDAYDAGNRTIMPGLIDAHVHMLSSGGNSGGDETRAMSDHQAMLQGAQNSLMAIKSGLTTVRDCGDRDFLSLTLRDSINSGQIPGPRMLCSGPVLTTTAGQLWWNAIECDTTDELRHAVRTLVKNGVDFIKMMGSGGNATPGSNPEASQYDAEGYHAVADDAHRMGKKVAVHVHGVEAIRMAVDAGMDTLEHVPFRADGTIKYDDQIAQDIVDKRLIVSLAMPATWYRLTEEDMRDTRTHPGHLWETRYDSIRKMHAAGVKLVVSSDQGSTGTRIDELALLAEFLVNDVGLPANDVIHGMTGLSAEALGIENQVGTLETGKQADIVILDGDPLTDIGALQRVHKVIKDGEVVASDGAILWSPSV
jgi:imidazolonepropionase-like amidohydrolase